jgi:hypothetical protein
VVVVNHRLNVFGHLYLKDIGGDDYADSGNAGMLDIITVLEWVRDNAAGFGGDAGNVTIFGQSGRRRQSEYPDGHAGSTGPVPQGNRHERRRPERHSRRPSF